MVHLKASRIGVNILVVIHLLLNPGMMINAQSKIEETKTSLLTTETTSITLEILPTEELEKENIIHWDMLLVVIMGFFMMCSGAYMMKKRRDNVKE